MASGVKDPGASAGVLNSLRSTAGPNTALEATGHSVGFYQTWVCTMWPAPQLGRSASAEHCEKAVPGDWGISIATT